MKKHALSSARSITQEMEQLLNNQIRMEALASARYLSMASWSETEGYEGASQFLYRHAEEERSHMMRIFRYLNEAGGQALVPALEQMPATYKDLPTVFQEVLEHELAVSRSINAIVAACLTSGDYTTHQFLTWFLNEQREEETIARRAWALFKNLDKHPAGLYFIDKALAKLHEK